MRKQILVTLVMALVGIATMLGTVVEGKAAVKPDAWEGNDCIEDAYPYDLVPVITDTVRTKYDTYTLGMRTASLDSAEDEDWYKVSLKAGTRYFMDLRNIGAKNWYTELYRKDSEGRKILEYTTNHNVDVKFKDARERYFYHTPTVTGTYYFRVTSGDDWEQQMNYFFFLGEAEQTFAISNLATERNILLTGSYNSYTFDLRNAVPAGSTILQLSVEDSFVSGYATGIDKRLTAGGKSYYNYTGHDEIRNITGVNLGQLWTISARGNSGQQTCRWSGRLSGTFRCKMKPYPGNELE